MKGTAEQILNASSNLLGFCLVIITSLKLFKFTEKTLVDEFMVVNLVLFITSCLLSFMALRADEVRGRKYETAAEYSFLAGLFILFLTTLLFALNVLA